MKIDHYGEDRDGIGIGSINEVGFAYMKKYGGKGLVEQSRASRRASTKREACRARSPAWASRAKTSNAPNHTYEMLADALTDVGHQGFVVDAQAMASLLFDFATHPEYRATVKKEFDAIKSLHGEYLDDLEKTYVVPTVPVP